MMKRDIWAATEPQPLDAPHADRADSASAAVRSPLLDAKVMMVDDEPLMTELIQTHLEDEGYTNFVVTNRPTEALELLRRERPGVLLLDLMMPGLSGFDVLEAIRADRDLRYTPVIVLTASTGADSKLRALQLGATDFLAKPVDASELVLRVRNTLAFRQYHERMTHYDQVTGLPNERLFEDSVDALLDGQALRQGLMALVSITVPECRQLRESVDRRAAEDLAIVVAKRLERAIAADKESCIFGNQADRRPRVARLGEQHFAAVLEGLPDLDAVEQRTEQLLRALSEPVGIGLHEVAPVPSIGVAVSPADGDNASALRRSADLAASHARELDGAQIAFASPELNEKSYRRITLGAQLRGAARRGELRLHYQPKVDVASSRVAGMEALVRWQHPDLGLVPPLQFISLAEELGLMGSIGEWVMTQACTDAAELSRLGHDGLCVAVNVSKPQVMSGELVSLARQCVASAGLSARQLVVEFTESMLMDDVRRCLALMGDLKDMGVLLSIDDFGTGYSSLAYLKQFPLDELKVDRSFVKDLPGQPRDRALVRSIVELGHSLGMSITAEGVETEAQLATLDELGCDLFQGFLFSKPACLEQVKTLVKP